ncbi:hypothetical protein [Neobacillus niacini]|uniref:hypothetical protein n=1 Tax=Neobacillus niacini TaxID=86668 RepID=UPI001C8E1690|nr:hypothetical protein [Neobacillus niacini]MBY0147751.1 hypothetical protein [Neobacillus niacini]
MKEEKLNRFGIDFDQGGAHFARTIMLEELRQLLTYVDEINAPKVTYRHAIEEENCLGKRSGSTRKITTSKLAILYGLDPELTVFRTLRYLWFRDEEARPLLAILCSIVRDRILRQSIPFILRMQEGEVFIKEQLEEYIESIEANQFTKLTIESTVRNLSSSWTQSGHLKGRIKKVKSRVIATPGAIVYALFLGYLMGARGKAMFETDFIKVTECNIEQAIELAESASRRGWIVMKRVGDVIEVHFPNFIDHKERGWIYEQG